MRENKIGVVVSLIISIISLGLIIASQYNYVTIKTLFCKAFPFIVGHRSLWVNIFMGIFSSSILMLASTLSGYFIERNRLDNKIKCLYYDLRCEFLRLYGNPVKRQAVFIEKTKELWNLSCQYDREDRPFYYKRERRIINKSIHWVIRDVEMLNCEYEDTEGCEKEYLGKIKAIMQNYNAIETYFKAIDERYRKRYGLNKNND